MKVSGTAAAMEKIFAPDLGIYLSREQGEFRGREGSLKVPAELKGIILGVHGFDQRRVARRRSGHGLSRGLSLTALAPMTPTALESYYDFPDGDGTGQKIAVAEFGGGYFEQDLGAFCAKYGLPKAKVQAVSVNAPAYTLAQIQKLPAQQQQDELDASGEVNMDIQIVAALCPAADIAVYFATFDQKGWVDLLDEVVQAKPIVLSVSWGAPEDSTDWSSTARNAINKRLNMCATLGITVCVSSGDDGSGDELTDGKAHVDFPSSSPFVLGVGGTMLTGGPPNEKEQVWWQSPGRRTGNGHSGAGGGGVSTVFARPSWQNVQIKSVNKNSIDGRVVPDVAALAGPPLYDLIFLGKDAPNGGTSASAPLWAAMLARINAQLPPAKQQRFLTPLLYQQGAGGKTVGQLGTRDITVGQNASHPQPGVGYSAMLGYDAVTGWGVPVGKNLLAAL
jgi:kumamolisin